MTKKFAVSGQHYLFDVQSFAAVVLSLGGDAYEYALRDRTTKRVEAALKAHTGVRPAKVIVFDADKLGTSSEHKAKRFVDERDSAK